MELPTMPQVSPGDDFRFMQAVTVIFDAGISLETPADLVKRLPELSHGSIYYHFVEARRRTPERLDDFSTWLSGFGEGPEELITALQSIDFYYLTLPELKDTLVGTICRDSIEVAHE